MEENCILFYLKYPEPGQVKKRLASHFEEELVTELYKQFVLDSLFTLEGCGAHLKLCFYPPEKEELVVKWIGSCYTYWPQQGHDLGERMKNSFCKAWQEGYKYTVITGSDIPDLPRSFIDDAFVKLRLNDLVIGPAVDGGYYLIGFRHDSFFPGVFDGMSWGTGTVYEKTLNKIEMRGLSVAPLPEWFDIDTPDDLRDLCERNRNTPFYKSNTISFIRENMPGMV
jgi:rSAM/selenodomain-associated transferase 1